MGASAGDGWIVSVEMLGSCDLCNMLARRRGDCAGVASGVWSGVVLYESLENVGDEGAVEKGEFWRERLRGIGSSSSCDRDRIIEWDEYPYWVNGGSRWPALWPLM